LQGHLADHRGPTRARLRPRLRRSAGGFRCRRGCRACRVGCHPHHEDLLRLAWDTRSNASLNAEWIRLTNTGSSAQQLGEWSISDAAVHVYEFGPFKLRAGRSVTVHTGDGTDTATHLYWGSGNYIWNNDKDTARLRRPNGRLADRCHYDNSSANPVTC
jgi:hypothetical protein